MQNLSWSIKNFLLTVLIPVVVTILAIPISFSLPSGQRLPFFIGVFASLVASCIFVCFSIYKDIRKTIYEIAKIVNDFESYCRIYGAQNLNTPEHIFTLNQMYDHVRYTSSSLIFSKDIEELMKAMKSVVNAVKNNKLDEVDQRVKDVEKIKQNALR